MRASAAAALFDERASAYDAAYDDPVHGRLLRRRLDVVLRQAGAGPGEALDAGMAGGRLLAELAAHGWQVSGIDLSPAMVALARERLGLDESRLVLAALERLPFGDERFDLVVATGVIEYADDPPRAARELARALRTGGRAIVSCPNSDALPVRIDHRLGRVRRGSKRASWSDGERQLESLLAGAGLTVVARESCSLRLLPRSLALLTPRIDDRLARSLERRGGAAAERFATQIVVTARKESS